MQGLEGWTFPHQWSMVDGTRLVTAWMNRLPGQRADGSFYEAPGLSVLEYAGDGKFASEYDHPPDHVLEFADVSRPAITNKAKK